MKYFLKNILSVFVGIFIVFMITAGLIAVPRPAHAQWAVFDAASVVKNEIGNVISAGIATLTNGLVLKEYALDGFAWMAAKSFLREMTSDMIKDVATGHTYPGGTGPGFITDLKGYALRVGDRAATTSINDIRNNIQPGATAYATSLAKSVGKHVRNEYDKSTSQTGFWSTHEETLSADVASTSDFFAGNFEDGGWNGFNAIDANVNNNPYYIYQSAENSNNKKVSVAKTNKKTLLGFGQGFLSNKNTPGIVIKSQLNKALGSGVASLVAADEIDEMIGSLAQGLVSKVVGSGGLTGVAGSATGGGASYLSRYLHEPPPAAYTKSTKLSMENQIARKENDVDGYIKNMQIILNATNKAVASLQQLISYTPPQTIYSSNDCTTTLNNDIVAAGSTLFDVQSAYSSSQQSATRAQQGLASLKQLKSKLQSASATDIQKIATQFRQLTSYDGELPGAQEISNAQTNSGTTIYGITTNGNNVTTPSTVTSSGVAGLTVSGGTTVDRMNLIAQNASNALGNIQTCFDSYLNNNF